MSHWADSPTEAHASVADALAVVDNLLSFSSTGQGKPSERERALFGAAVVFVYGIWENFVEQLAIELVQQVAPTAAPEKVPDQITKMLQTKSAWELVTPGWQALWIRRVQTEAVGDDADKHGMNTAREGQVKQLLALVGVEDPYSGIKKTSIPPYLAGKTVKETINELVKLRGEIVHTGKIPDALRKGQVRAWRTFVADSTEALDGACRAECKRRYASGGSVATV